MANIQKFGDALSSIGQALMMTDPRYAPVVEQMKRQKMLEQEFTQEQEDRRRALEKESALKSFAQSLQNGPVNLESALSQYSAASGDPSIMLNYLMQQNDPARKLQLQSAQLQLEQARNEQKRTSALAALFSGQQSPNGVPAQQGVMGPVQPTALQQLSPLQLTQRAAAIAPEQFMDDYLSLVTAKPEERKTAQDVNGVLRYVDSGQPVFPGVEVPVKPPNTTGLPEGYKWDDNGNAVPIEGVKPGTKPTAESEKARKLAEESISNLQTAKDIIYNDDGSVNRSAIQLLPYVSLGGGRTFRQAMERAIQNSVYLKTGQAAPESEINRLMGLYSPAVMDTDEQINLKIDSLEQFLSSNAPEYAAPALKSFANKKSGLSPEKQRRLEELRAKRDAGTLDAN